MSVESGQRTGGKYKFKITFIGKDGLENKEWSAEWETVISIIKEFSRWNSITNVSINQE